MRAPRSIDFFALPTDMILLMTAVENATDIPIRLLQFGPVPNARNASAWGVEVNKDLAIAKTRQSITEPQFLVMPRNSPTSVREVRSPGGDIRQIIDQLQNPDSVVIRFGGLLPTGDILQGSVGTSSKSTASTKLMRAFAAAFKLHFPKIRAFYVGPEALEKGRTGCRLTSCLDSALEWDLEL